VSPATEKERAGIRLLARRGWSLARIGEAYQHLDAAEIVAARAAGEAEAQAIVKASRRARACGADRA
jgi:hypothetical protein